MFGKSKKDKVIHVKESPILKDSHVSNMNIAKNVTKDAAHINRSKDKTGESQTEPFGFVKILIFAVVAFALQSFLAPIIAIFGVSPNFFIIDVVLISFLARSKGAILNAFIVGIVFDLMLPGPVGAMSLSLVVVAFFISALKESARASGFVLYLISMVAAAIVACFIYGILLSVFGFTSSFWSSIVFYILPTCGYTLLLGTILSFLILRKFG